LSLSRRDQTRAIDQPPPKQTGKPATTQAKPDQAHSIEITNPTKRESISQDIHKNHPGLTLQNNPINLANPQANSKTGNTLSIQISNHQNPNNNNPRI
jgi:hypothetical protein